MEEKLGVSSREESRITITFNQSCTVGGDGVKQYMGEVYHCANILHGMGLRIRKHRTHIRIFTQVWKESHEIDSLKHQMLTV